MAYRQRAIPVAAVKNRKKSDAKGAKNDNMKKRLQRICSCVLLCAALLAAALPAPAAASSTGFSDVPESHWAADAIRRAVDLGLFHGQTKTRFGLGQPMTRAAAVGPPPPGRGAGARPRATRRTLRDGGGPTPGTPPS